MKNDIFFFWLHDKALFIFALIFFNKYMTLNKKKMYKTNHKSDKILNQHIFLHE